MRLRKLQSKVLPHRLFFLPDNKAIAMMPHIERAFLPWQWPYYPEGRKDDEVAPWIEAFVNAFNWIKNNR